LALFDALRLAAASIAPAAFLETPSLRAIEDCTALKPVCFFTDDPFSDGGVRMTTLAKLLAEKQQLIERLEKNPGPQEREAIERLLEKINTALNLLDDAGPGSNNG